MLFRIFAEVFSKDYRYLVRKPMGRDNQHRGHRTGDVELIYISEIVSGKRILKWREGTEKGLSILK